MVTCKCHIDDTTSTPDIAIAMAQLLNPYLFRTLDHLYILIINVSGHFNFKIFATKFFSLEQNNTNIECVLLEKSLLNYILDNSIPE